MCYNSIIASATPFAAILAAMRVAEQPPVAPQLVLPQPYVFYKVYDAHGNPFDVPVEKNQEIIQTKRTNVSGERIRAKHLCHVLPATDEVPAPAEAISVHA